MSKRDVTKSWTRDAARRCLSIEPHGRVDVACTDCGRELKKRPAGRNTYLCAPCYFARRGERIVMRRAEDGSIVLDLEPEEGAGGALGD